MASKPGRPATSGTRHGNGSHGPAKNVAAPDYNASNQPSPEAKSAGHDVAAQIRERISAQRNAIVDAMLARALDPAHPQGHQSSADLLDRIAPKTAKIEHGGPDGGPMLIRRVIVDPREAGDA